jgi:hypothetical protein
MGLSAHTIMRFDDLKKQYTIRYNDSGNEVAVRFVDVCAIYLELYRRGLLTNEYMNTHCRRILGWSVWRRPGSAIFDILPRLDGNVSADGGRLYVSER